MKRKKCKELSILLVDYLDGRLSGKVSVRIERHIRECDECEELLERYKECVRALQEIEINVPDDLEVKLLNLLQEMKES